MYGCFCSAIQLVEVVSRLVVRRGTARLSPLFSCVRSEDLLMFFMSTSLIVAAACAGRALLVKLFFVFSLYFSLYFSITLDSCIWSAGVCFCWTRTSVCDGVGFSHSYFWISGACFLRHVVFGACSCASTLLAVSLRWFSNYVG